MKLKTLIGEIVRVKDRRIVGKKRSALLLAVSHDGATAFLRLTQNGSKIEAQSCDVSETAFGREMAKRMC